MAHYHVFIHDLILRMLLNSLAVNHEQFLVQITHKSKAHNNAGFTKWAPLKLLWSENADLKSSASNGVKDDNKKPAEQREHSLSTAKATPSTRDRRGYSDRKLVQRHRQNTREQLLCFRNRWREGKPTADASRKCRKESDEESERLEFTVKNEN